MKTPRRLHLLPVISLAALLAGCSSEGSLFTFEGVEPASLERAKSCADLETKLKVDARTRMNRYVDLQIASIRYWESQRGWFGWGMPVDDAMGGDGDGSTSGGAPESGGPPSHSETNTQIEGVDEADIAKTDGERIYFLHGRSLTILRSWPLTELGVESTLGIEGEPIEMFVDAGKAVVYSRVAAEDVYLQAGKEASGAGCEYCYAPMTKLTVVDVSGAAPGVIAEQYIQGDYVSARRIGARVQTVVSGGSSEVFQLYPEFYAWGADDDGEDLIEAYEEMRARNEEAIAAATLDDLLPDRFLAGAAGLEQADAACQDVYIPTSGTTDFGVTQIHSLDLSNPADTGQETIVFGATSTIYQNHDSLILAAQSWSAHTGLGPVWDLDEEPISLVGTHLHVFALTEEEGAPTYRASATVPGRIDDQFALDERAGIVRVATTEQLASRDMWGTTANDLFTLTLGDRTLSPAGEVRDLAPGEQIFATRYVEDKAYVVTFRQIDPLFVIDLADPARPTVLGELKIPGFSEYMHPLNGGTHLLTVGVDGDEDGFTNGIALQIFDVSSPTEPKLAHKLPLGDSGGWSWSEALNNHKALTFYDGYLAVPVEGFDGGQNRSGLGLFTIDATAGITEVGRVDHTQYFDASGYDSCYYGYGVRRGLFIEDHVVSVSQAAVVASPLTDLASVTSAVELPEVGGTCNYYEGEGGF